ncbi:MAG: AtpZ/AtpI family protein [Methylocystaceae bacterium]
MAEPEKKNPPTVWEGVGRYLSLSTNMVASVILGLALGYYLDKWLNTEPWLMFLMLLLGVATGLKMTYDEVIGREEKQGKKDDN